MLDFDKETVDALVEWAESTTFPKQIELSENEKIINSSAFVQSCLCDIRRHYPDPIYAPSIERLYRLRECMEKRSADSDKHSADSDKHS